MSADALSPVPSTAARRIAFGALAAWLLIAGAAVGAGDPPGALWSGAALGLLIAAVWSARWPVFRRACASGIALYALGLTAATLAVGWTGTAEDARVQLFASNPNVLAAALVSAYGAWAAVAPRRRWVWWGWPLVAVAVLHTGSRTAGGALLLAGTVWLVTQAVAGRSRWAWAPVVAVSTLAAAAFAWQYGVVERTPNLLAAPSDLTDRAWRHDLAASVEVREEGAPGPFAGTTAQRLIATARANRTHLVHQSIGRSEDGVPYVASIFLRSDTPQRFTLTSHLASVTCEVGTEWSRCVTPVGYGDDYAQRQIHLHAPVRGGSVDAEVFGAQYERGTAATPFLDARPAWVPQTMVNRFDLRRVTFVPENRVPPWRAGIALFGEHPWFGVGPTAAPEAFLERTGRTMRQPVHYAHNVLVQWLAVHGLVGFAGIALAAVATLSQLSGPAWSRLAPLLAAFVMLNTWDVTFHEPLVFTPALLALASVLAIRRPGAVER